MMARWPRAVRMLGLALVLVLLSNQFGVDLAGPPIARAATITVNTLEDSFVANGNCSLREAISSANQNVAFDACTAGAAGADVINITVGGTITLALAGKNEDNNATGDFDILETLTINGNLGFLSTSINANFVDRAFDIQSGGALTLNDMRIFQGSPNSGGSNGAGGNIFSNGDLELNRVSINQGTAGNGAGIFVAGGATFTATDSGFYGNVAVGNPNPINGGAGGGVFLDFNSVVTMNRVSFEGNQAISVSATGARGAAIFNDGNATSLTNVQLTGNFATGVGSGAARGGAIFNDEILRMTHVTLHSNTLLGAGVPTGGGIFNNGSVFEVTNTIIALNSPDNCAQTISFLGFNLENGVSCGFIGAGQLNADPQFGPGGAVRYAVVVRELGPGSPAIDAAETARCVAVDAVGTARPIDGDGNGSLLCDIGAYEASYIAPTPTPTLTPTITPTGLPSATPTPTPEPQNKPNNDDKTVSNRPPSEEIQRQKDRTNKGNRDDDFVEGNVVAVFPDAPIPYAMVANRDGPVKVLLIGEAAQSARSIKVGDYLEADGVKEHEFLFEAETVKITRR